MSLIAVTGATGRVGGRVARALAQDGTAQRLVVRDASRAPQLPGAEVRTATYGDSAASRAALAGVDVLFMVSAAEAQDRVQQHLDLVDAAADAGVRHVVYTSFYGASPTAAFTLGRDHHATEERIKERIPAWTLLRDNLYADFMPLLAGEDRVLRGPAAEGRLSAVAIDDVADVAVAVLRDPAAHTGRTYALTGPEDLSLSEVAEILTRTTGQPYRYEDETLEQAYASRASYGAPDWEVEAWVSTYTSIASGEMAGVSPDVADVTGHPARSLSDLMTREGGPVR